LLRAVGRGNARAVPIVDLQRLPRHVAIIMDGNGRWASAQGHARSDGHREGSKAVRRIVRAARKMGVDALTMYAFSEQNWQRPLVEVTALMELLSEFLISERRELIENGIRLRAIGRRQELPRPVRQVLEALEADTADLSEMTLTLALSYGGQEEITDACRAIAERVRAGELTCEAIDEKVVGAAIPSVDVGQVDLLIRTGGEQRISNFLLWGAAYAELVFTDRLWPDMHEEDLHEAICAYQMRDRRFGRAPDADAGEPTDPTPARRASE